MKKLIVLNSITTAYKARDYLFNKGIKVYIERVPTHMRSGGCGYGVRVVGDVLIAVKLLEQNNIKVRNIIELPM